MRGLADEKEDELRKLMEALESEDAARPVVSRQRQRKSHSGEFVSTAGSARFQAAAGATGAGAGAAAAAAPHGSEGEAPAERARRSRPRPRHGGPSSGPPAPAAAEDLGGGGGGGGGLAAAEPPRSARRDAAPSAGPESGPSAEPRAHQDAAAVDHESGLGADDDEPRRFFGPSKDIGNAQDGAMPVPRMGEPLTAEQAEGLMRIVGVPQLPDAWKQGFFFAGYQPYGLQQVEGGPCGVLATVQALVLMSLLQRSGGSHAGVLEVDEKTRHEALVDAICEVLFRNAGDNNKAIVLLPSSFSVAPLSVAQLRCLRPAHFTSYEQLHHYLHQRPYRDLFFNPSGCGVPLLLYSVILTRGAEGIRDRDVDDPKTGVMIGAHGYCTQELVNLMVFGRAYSNVFDGSKRLGSAQDGWYVMQGAPRRPKVGFLSLFEAKNDCIEVGSRYKGPASSVWIVCAESHYSVLFAVDPSVDPRDSRRALELYYFDQFGRQDQKIRLSVTPERLPSHLTTGYEEGESIIDQCIRTKWKEAAVDWNGVEKIL